MKSKTFLLPSLLAVALANHSNGSVFIENFQVGYSTGDMTTGGNAANGWSVNDSTADVSSIINTSNAGGTFGNRSASIGFVAPITATTAYLSHAVNTPLLGGGVDASFSTQFFIFDSDSGGVSDGEARDTFGFRFEDGIGNNIFSFFLTPFDQDPLPENDTAFHTFSWSTGNNAPTVVLPGLAAQEGQPPYTFAINFSPSGLNDVAFTANVGGSPFSGTLVGLAATTIEKIGATWTPLNGPTDPGSNILIFDNISLVPEPSSALLGLIGISSLVIRRRRA